MKSKVLNALLNVKNVNLLMITVLNVSKDLIEKELLLVVVFLVSMIIKVLILIVRNVLLGAIHGKLKIIYTLLFLFSYIIYNIFISLSSTHCTACEEGRVLNNFTNECECPEGQKATNNN